MPLTAKVTRTAVDRPKTLTKASQQWRERPADERFESLAALLDATRGHRARAQMAQTAINEITIESQGETIYLVGPQGGKIVPNHWSFGQLCQRAGAPAGYIRSLPTSLAVSNLQHGLKNADEDKDARLLIEKPEGGNVGVLRAITTDKYKRIWNHEVAETLVALQERYPSWQFPEPFRKVTGSNAKPHGQAEGKQIPIAYASDHDMFVFLCDYERGIDLGDGNVLARGFFVENSEVGDGSFRLTTFLFDFVCCNILVWGARHVTEVRLNHVGKVRDRVLRGDSQVLKALSAYANTSAHAQKQQILNAQNVILGKDDDEVLSVLFGRKSLGLSKADIVTAQHVANTTPRYGNPRSVWAIVNGLTETSQQTTYADQRIKLDRAAGHVLETFAF
jgi:Domain of unknown function (DUF932)